jgi:hypothetical protein
VRTPRTAGKKKDEILSFHYAFVEFSTEAECEKAKNKLATSRFQAVLRIRIRVHRIHVFLGLLDPDPSV